MGQWWKLADDEKRSDSYKMNARQRSAKISKIRDDKELHS